MKINATLAPPGYGKHNSLAKSVVLAKAEYDIMPLLKIMSSIKRPTSAMPSVMEDVLWGLISKITERLMILAKRYDLESWML